MKYLIYKTSGGLNHMLNQINNAVYLSLATNRFLIIDTYGGAFKQDFNKWFRIPCLEYSTDLSILNGRYVDAPDEYPKLIRGDTRQFRGEVLNNDFNYVKRSSEEIVYINATDEYLKFLGINSYLYRGKVLNNDFNYVKRSSEEFLVVTYMTNMPRLNYWFITVKPDILAGLRVKEISGEYLGVHFRNTDMKHDIDQKIEQIRQYEHKKIYLATDDFNSIKKFKTALKDREIIHYTTPYILTEGQDNIHFSNPDKEEVIYNALLDMYMLINASDFIASEKSSFSRYVAKYRKKNLFFINDDVSIGENIKLLVQDNIRIKDIYEDIRILYDKSNLKKVLTFQRKVLTFIKNISKKLRIYRFLKIIIDILKK